MRPQQQYRVDQLEQLLRAHSNQGGAAFIQPGVSAGVDDEVQAMAQFAQQLRASSSLLPDPAFAQQLERKILAHNVRYAQAKKTKNRWSWLFSEKGVPRVQFVLATILFCLLLAGTSTVLVMAETVSNPDNPLYHVKVWEQQVQLSLANSPQNRADVSLHIIRDRLSIIPTLADPSHTNAYEQTVDDIKGQIENITSIINTLPAGADHDHLVSELATVKNDTRQTLYGVLLKLPLTEQITTTTLLGQLGAPVPEIQQVTILITRRPTSQAIVTIKGTNLTNTTRLIVNMQVIKSNCVVQENTCVFTFPWHKANPPGDIAVLNADGTVIETTHMTLVSGSGNDGNKGTSGNENGTGKNGKGTNPTGGNTNGNRPHKGKSTSTPDHTYIYTNTHIFSP